VALGAHQASSARESTSGARDPLAANGGPLSSERVMRRGRRRIEATRMP